MRGLGKVNEGWNRKYRRDVGASCTHNVTCMWALEEDGYESVGAQSVCTETLVCLLGIEYSQPQSDINP